MQGKFPAVKEVGYESTHCTQPERRGAAGAGVESLGGRPGDSGGDGTGLWNETAARLACRRGQDRGPAAGRGGDESGPHAGAGAGCVPARAGAGKLQGKRCGHPAGPDEAGQGEYPAQGHRDAHLQEEHAAFTAAAKEQA